MRTVNIVFLLVCISLLPAVATAQTNYLPGYYVSNNSDTVQGFIQYRATTRMHRVITFKPSGQGRAVKLRPGNTVSVVIDGRNYFESHSISDRRGSTDVVFLKKIIVGRLSLYVYNDRYFARKEGEDQLHEITRTTRVRDDNKITADYVGFGTVKLLTQDCSTFDEQFLMDQYKSSPNYKAMVSKYNECFSVTPSIIKDIRIRGHVDYGVQGSLNLTKMNFKSTRYLDDADFGNPISATGGIFFSLFVPRLGDNARIVWEPGFGYSNRYSYFQNSSGVQDVYLRYSYIRSPLLLRYFFKNRVFFDIGVNNFLVLKQDATWRVENVSNNFVVTSDGPAYRIRSGVKGACIGIGSRFNFGGIPIYTSLRISSILPFHIYLSEQPKVQWLDLNVALQLNRR